MAYVIPQEKLITLTAGHIRAMMSSQGVDDLSALVQVYKSPEAFYPSEFAVMVFDLWPQDTYRCDELLRQLKVTAVKDMRFVVLTFVDGEARLENADHAGQIVARCQMA